MNRRPPGPKLSKAISGFVQHKTAAGLASTIIQGYERDLKKWGTHIGDVDIGDVTTQEVRDYLARLAAHRIQTTPVVRCRPSSVAQNDPQCVGCVVVLLHD